MARIIDGAGGGNDAQNGETVTFSAHGADKIDVASNDFIADAQMSREGQDLILTAPDGDSVIIEGYFSVDPAPVIAGPHGSSLSPELVNSFLTSAPHYAQNATVTDESPVGAVEEIKGNATVTRADGSTETLALGSPIYQGDVISTDAQGAVNVVFVDETSMAVSANARMAIDEYSFDPASESGTTNFSVLRGVFVFTSGLIGRDDPDDVAIETPVGSIGIRGTIIAGNINPGGESEITVVEGAIVITNNVMEKTLSQQFETVKLGGLDSQMTDMGVLSAKAVGTAFGAVSDVAPSLFSAINDAANEQSPAESDRGASEENSEGETSDKPANEQPAQEAPQDMQMNNLDTPFKTNAFSEDTFKEKIATQTHGTTEVAETAFVTRTETKTAFDTKSMAVSEPPAPPSTTQTQNTGSTGTTTDPGNSIVITPPSPIDLASFGASDRVNKISDNAGNAIGYSVTGVGDANKDGYADIMFSNNTSAAGQNHTYVAYGSVNGISSVGLNMPVIDPMITSLGDTDASAGEIGILANPGASSDYSHTLVQGIGDFDGDGVADYLIGQRYLDGILPLSGMAFIMSGATGNVRAIHGLGNFAQTGASISALGDINNDGYADIIVGAPGTNTDFGQAFVIYGSATPPSMFDLANLLMVEGVRKDGSALGEALGTAVAGVGDFNGDGYLDYAIGAPGVNFGHGRVTIYSGQNNTIITQVSTTIANHRLGTDIFNLGDINGDGKSDILIAGDGVETQGYIVFGGSASGISDVSDAGSSAHKITMPAGHVILGGGAAGDFNGDGYNDFVFAVREGADAGIYVVYGKSLNNASGVDNTLTLAELNSGDYAFKMTYTGAGGLDFDFSSAGDTDGDGYDDLIIGVTEANSNNGEVFVVHGRQGGMNTYVTDGSAHDSDGSDNSVRASANGQSMVLTGAQSGSDGNNNDISIRGGNGNNVIEINNQNFSSINGGFGVDHLRFGLIGGSLDLRSVDSERIQQVEYLEFGQANQTITLSMENIFNLLKASDTGELKITFTGDGANGQLRLDANTASGTATPMGIVMAMNEMGTGGGPTAYHDTGASGGGFQAFDIGGYTLYINDAIMANTQIV